MVHLHFALVRSHLDYGVQLWAPNLDKGKVPSGASGQHRAGANHVQVMDTLAKLWLVSWQVLG